MEAVARCLNPTGCSISHQLWSRSRAQQSPRQRRPAGRAARAGGVAVHADIAAHGEAQAGYFNDPATITQFLQPLPEDIQQRLATIVAALPDLHAGSRVVDVGAGTGCLVPHLRAAGVADILAVDLAAGMLAALAQRFPAPSTLGNEPGVRTWQGDVAELPAFQGPADAFVFNAVFGNLADPRAALLRAALMLRPGGHVVLSHPMGRTWHSQLATEMPQVVPHALPDEAQLAALVAGLPLRVVQLRDEPQLYLALLQVPPGYAFPQAPVRMEGPVVVGFGRGSRQLGVPTANLDVPSVAQQLQGLHPGVYFGWAQLDAPEGWPASDRHVHKMVMNVGTRPTVNTGDEAATVEVHVLHAFGGADFHGARLRVLALGFLRPELKFNGLAALLARIKTDIAVARAQLDQPDAQQHARDPLFKTM